MIKLEMEPALITLDKINKNYRLGGVNWSILKNISLQVCQGESVAIIGMSGSGKSTLMNIIGLLDKADSGSYRLQQRNTAKLSDDELAILRNECIGFVFQQFNLLPRFTAEQNIALPLFYRKFNKQKINALVKFALEQVGMAAFATHRPSQLSGGQQQRIAIARALVTQPKVILADEPTGALDSRTGMEIMNLFLQLHSKGCTLIIITHDGNIASLCNRIITLVDGEIVDGKILDATT